MSNILVNQLTGNTTDTTIDVFAGHAADSTTRTNLEQGLSKMWCRWGMDSTQAIGDSLNVTSIADNGVGQTTITIANDFNNANYSYTFGSRYNTSNANGLVVDASNAETVGSFKVRGVTMNTNSSSDIEECNVTIHGDLA